MCGIAGIFRHDAAPVSGDDVSRMLDTLRHRGPDDEGVHLDRHVGLGHRRLSIIDVSSAGHQPMPNAAGNTWITYNGEIYNYRELRAQLEQEGCRFQSDSDTEVILQAYEAWGTDCLQKFNGMFAFAIWDSQKQQLFCARDRIGIKPFYYFDDGQRLAFASEIKAFTTLPGFRAEPEPASLLDYLAFSFVRGERTLFRGVHKLLPGEMMIVSPNRVQRSPYWSVEFDESDSRSEADILEEIAWLVDDAVRIQLRADVPVGTHLSGGLDSSLVTALARRHHPGKLFSFNGRFADGAEYDESPHARVVADSAGVQLVDVMVGPENFLANLAHLAWHMDEPTAGPGLYPQYFVCKAARQHVTVALGGQGGDETFVGYPRYRNDLARYHVVSALRGRGLTPGFSFTSELRTVMQSGGLRGVVSLMARNLLPLPAPESVVRLLRATASQWNLTLSESQFREIEDREHQQVIPAKRSALGRLLHHDLKNYLPALLHVEDRTSMAVSLESRVPLLDHRIVECMARVPSALKLPRHELKYLLRKVAEPVLPHSIVYRKDKKGFPTPLMLWLGKMRNDRDVIDLLGAPSLRRTGLLGKANDALPDDWARNWATMSLELWTRVFVEQSLPHTTSTNMRRAS